MECPICLSELKNTKCIGSERIIHTPCCSQQIHKKCLYQWLSGEQNNTCPLCRESLKINTTPICRIHCNRYKRLLYVRGFIFILSSIAFILAVTTKYTILSTIVFIVILVLFILSVIHLVCENIVSDNITTPTRDYINIRARYSIVRVTES